MDKNDIFLNPEFIENKDFYNKISDIISCPICNGILIEPIQCETCENNYCKICIENWLKKSNSCPFKCSSLPKFKQSSRQTKSLLETLLFSCENSCGKNNINYNEIIKHYSNECPKLNKNCPLCNQIIPKESSLNIDDYLIVKKNKEIHWNISCNKCGMENIIGNRYKCSDCMEYNLCDVCEEENGKINFHPHVFLKMRKSEFKDKNDFDNKNKNFNNDNNEKINNNFNNNNFNNTNNNYNNDNYSFKIISNPKKLNIRINSNNINSYNVNIKIINNGKYQWIDNKTFLICDKIKSDFLCNDINLPALHNGKIAYISLKFNNLNLFKDGKYKCFIDFWCNEIKYGPSIIINLTISKEKKINNNFDNNYYFENSKNNNNNFDNNNYYNNSQNNNNNKEEQKINNIDLILDEFTNESRKIEKNHIKYKKKKIKNNFNNNQFFNASNI